MKFQPALPMRGVTLHDGVARVAVLISTRTPHAGSDALAQEMGIGEYISTRTPHAGSDVTPEGTPVKVYIFQPALPMRGVTLPSCRSVSTRDFNPHSPCGE